MYVLFGLFYFVFKFAVTVNWPHVRTVELFKIFHICFLDICEVVLADAFVLHGIMSMSPDDREKIR
jgi:hypothetical protein